MLPFIINYDFVTFFYIMKKIPAYVKIMNFQTPFLCFLSELLGNTKATHLLDLHIKTMEAFLFLQKGFYLLSITD